ncbi:myeloperoxidase-like [Protopterus annectens]|uniref:myeloperoxidase-like n=1 Tax=Protopterus annectens TaxID=7888 RepID=UPI001CFB2EC9|nr:myeloperoxidase-like [Protopterus annectens]
MEHLNDIRNNKVTNTLAKHRSDFGLQHTFKFLVLQIINTLSTYIPINHPLIEAYMKLTEDKLFQYYDQCLGKHRDGLKYNLTLSEREALDNMKVNSNIIIRPADKGSSIVVMDYMQYDAIMMAMLSDLTLATRIVQQRRQRNGKKLRHPPLRPQVRALLCKAEFDPEKWEDDLPLTDEGDSDFEIANSPSVEIIATVWEGANLFRRQHLDGPYDCLDPIPLFEEEDVANLTMTSLRILLVLLLLHSLDNTHVTALEETLDSTFVNDTIEEAIQKVDGAYKYTAEANQQKLSQHSISPSVLLSAFKQPVMETKSAIRAAEYKDVALHLIQSHVLELYNDSISITDILSIEDVEVIDEVTGCAEQTKKKKCKNTCFSRKYRTITGECNNRKHPDWGASNTPFVRWLPPQYEDNLGLPRGWTEGKLYSGFPLPLVRKVSNKILYNTDVNFPGDKELSHMFVQWGQWVDHDLDLTPESHSTKDFNDGIDCEKSCVKMNPCYPIQVPPDDPRIKNKNTCIPFFRSSPACGSRGLSYMFKDVTVRQQLNAITSFIDASQVYGSTETTANSLRNLSSPEGLLAVNTNFTDNGLAYLPFENSTNSPCRLMHNASGVLTEPAIPCFVAGDPRATEQISLIAIHTLFLREHNRICKQMKQLNPHWDKETIYQEARKIVGAQLQIITYKHFLPHVIGTSAMKCHLSKRYSYNPFVNPAVANVFATAAFRFGHGMVMPKVPRQNEAFQEHPEYPDVPLHQAFFAAWKVIKEGGIDPLLRGLLGTPAKQLKQDQLMNNELRDRLFEITQHIGLDLASLNMQRGRDHGIPGYNDWRKFCGLSQPQNVAELSAVLHNAEVAQKLIDVYGSPNNIDVWLGGILEPPSDDGRVGPLFSSIIGKQFQNLRDGDRYFILLVLLFV